MKFSAILFAAGASAAVIAQRDPVFAVTNFSAGCIAHSTQCLYNFNLTQPGTGQVTPQVCKALVSANTDGSLPNVVDGACEETSRTFSVTKADKGLTLTVSQPVTPSSNQTGSHLITNCQLVYQDSPNVHVQQYRGPTSFSLDS
ncbi:hypersensitive response-inducing protein [Nemania abortiva]|nr:hypersensitive response-inducing protein [Nemania abortiva]